jgi:hypothetical protein
VELVQDSVRNPPWRRLALLHVELLGIEAARQANGSKTYGHHSNHSKRTDMEVVSSLTSQAAHRIQSIETLCIQIAFAALPSSQNQLLSSVMVRNHIETRACVEANQAEFSRFHKPETSWIKNMTYTSKVDAQFTSTKLFVHRSIIIK